MEKNEEMKKIKIIFNPKNKTIESNTEDILEIYSEWKRWVVSDYKNAMYQPAFEFKKDLPILINEWFLIIKV